MQVTRLDANYASTRVQNEEYARKRSVSLHQNSTFQMGGSGLDLSALTKAGGSIESAVNNTQSSRLLQTRDGNEIDIPQLNAQQKDAVSKLYASVSDEGKARLHAAGKAVGAASFNVVAAQREAGTPEGMAKLEAANATLRSAVEDNVNAIAAEKFKKHSSALTGAEFEEGMTDAMTNGMAGVENDLNEIVQGYVDKAKMGEELETDAAELADMLGSWGDDETQSFTYHELVTDENGVKSLVEKTTTLTKAEAEDLYNSLKAGANDLTTMSALDQYTLQIKVQDYQQAMTTLSNVMKSFSDDLKGIIGNLRA